MLGGCAHYMCSPGERGFVKKGEMNSEVAGYHDEGQKPFHWELEGMQMARGSRVGTQAGSGAAAVSCSELLRDPSPQQSYPRRLPHHRPRLR